MEDTLGHVLYDLHHDTIPSKERDRRWENACDFERARWERLAGRFISRLNNSSLKLPFQLNPGEAPINPIHKRKIS